MASYSNEDQGKAFVEVLAAVLTRLVENNDESGAAAAAEVTRFHALRPPNISIRDYLERIHKYASCSAECFILALVYIDRLIQGNNLTLTSLNVHRVIITSVMLGAKFFDDQYFNNAYYAKVGGVPCPEMNSLELEFLFSINFSLHVSGEVYNRYRGELAAHMASMMPGPQAAHLHEVMVSARAAAEPAVLAPPMVLTATPGVPAAPVYVPGSGAHPVASAAAAVASGAGHASSSTSQPATAAFAQGHGWAPPAAEDDDDVEMGGGAAPAEATGWAPATAFGGSSSGAQ